MVFGVCTDALVHGFCVYVRRSVDDLVGPLVFSLVSAVFLALLSDGVDAYPAARVCLSGFNLSQGLPMVLVVIPCVSAIVPQTSSTVPFLASVLVRWWRCVQKFQMVSVVSCND